MYVVAIDEKRGVPMDELLLMLAGMMVCAGAVVFMLDAFFPADTIYITPDS